MQECEAVNYFFFLVSAQIAMPMTTPIPTTIAPIMPRKLVLTWKLHANAHSWSTVFGIITAICTAFVAGQFPQT